LIRTLSGVLAGALLFGTIQTAAAADWQYYEAKSYGFSMLVPTGTTVREKEWGGGWGQLGSEHEGVKLYGLAKLGAKESDQEIEKFAVRVIGIPANEWKQIDAGKGRGWERYRTFEAVRGDRLYFGGYGVGRRGNYLLYLETTVSDYNAHKADYIKWYESVRLD
jgi:hypothetical protein